MQIAQTFPESRRKVRSLGLRSQIGQMEGESATPQVGRFEANSFGQTHF